MLPLLLRCTALLGLCCSPLPGAVPQDAAPLDRYRLHVEVARQRVEVVADLDYRALADGERELRFYLPRDMAFTEVRCPGKVEHHFASDDSFVSAVAHVLTVVLEEPLAAGDPCPLHLEYSGQLPGAFEAEWVEFFADANFAPMHCSFDRSTLFEVTLDIEEDGYQVFSYGDTRRTEEGWILSTERPCGDVPFVAGRGLEFFQAEEDGFEVEVAHVGAEQEALTGLARQATWILAYYNDTFGVDQPHHRVRFVIRPTDRGLGYARPGYILLARSALQGERPAVGGNRAEVSQFAFVAHEIAHLWWSLGNPTGYENWLNESFAEYSSLLALRERHGEEHYQRDIASKRQISESLPGILGIERTHPQSFLLFYRKGPWLLHGLQEELGQGEFVEFLVIVQSEQVRTSEHLLRLLAELHGDELARRLREQLSH